MTTSRSRTKVLTLAAIMATMSSILSLEFFTVPIVIGPFSSKIHFTQLPIFISGILGGSVAGLLTGAISGLFMGYLVGIPFIVGGLALLGFSNGFFTNNLNLRPGISSILAWCVQAPYVLITDYIWFTYSRLMSSSVALTVVTTILVNLTIEAVISSALAAIIIRYIRRTNLF